MSTSLFAAKQYKSSRNLKKLAISSPINTKSPTASLQLSPLFSPLSRDPVIVLRARYDFKAESPVEISVKRNDYVKLVHRPGNGWLLVKFIDKTDSGLIPASYVDIAANDIQKPITLEWLLETEAPAQRRKEQIQNIRINTVLQNRKMRYLYRLDITMNSGKQVFLCKYYQDFYNLHIALVTSLGRQVPLPVFPKPRALLDRTQNKTTPDQAEIKNLLEVAGQLSKYLRQLLIIENVRACDEFVEFLEDEQFKRIVVRPEDPPIADAKINDMLHKDLVNIVDSLLRADMSLKNVSTPSPVQTPSPRQNRPNQKRQLLALPSLAALYPLFVSPSEVPLVTSSPEQETVTESPMAESKSSQTLSTYSSLLAGYGEDEMGSNLQESKTTESSESQLNLNETTLQDPIDLPDTKKHAAAVKGLDMSHDSVSTIGSKGVLCHYLSGEDLLMLNRHKSQSVEPKTPNLSLDDFVRHPPNLFGSDEDEQIKPLQPKKHKEAYMSASSSNATLTQETKKKVGEFVRIKVTLCNEDDDKVVLRARRSELHSLQALKHMVLLKIYDDLSLVHHYTLRPFEEVPGRAMDEKALLEYVRNGPKAHLRLQRLR